MGRQKKSHYHIRGQSKKNIIISYADRTKKMIIISNVSRVRKMPLSDLRTERRKRPVSHLRADLNVSLIEFKLYFDEDIYILIEKSLLKYGYL